MSLQSREVGVFQERAIHVRQGGDDVKVFGCAKGAKSLFFDARKDVGGVLELLE